MSILTRILRNKRINRARKLLALISLARMASKESLAVLETYCRRAAPGLKDYAKLICAETRLAVNKRYGSCGR